MERLADDIAKDHFKSCNEAKETKTKQKHVKRLKD